MPAQRRETGAAVKIRGMHPRTTRALRPALAGALVAAGIGAGCGPAGPPAAMPTPAAAADECVLRSVESVRTREVLVFTGTEGDSTLLAGLRLEPPVRLDCRKRPRPGLASAWSSDSAGRAWTLIFPDAGIVAETWRRRADAVAALRFGGVESVVPLDGRRLVVTFSAAYDTLPSLFADPALGLSRDSLAARMLRPMPPGDARDALDRGADVIRTSDPRALDYAATRADLAVIALPWDRTYALVLPATSPGLGSSGGSDGAGFQAALADAVRVEARAAEPPFWWEAAFCGDRSRSH